MLNIAIIGGAGFIGKSLVSELSNLKLRTRIKIIDCNFQDEDKDSSNKGISENINCNVLDLDKLKEVLHGSDVVFHKAGLLGRPDRSTDMRSAKDYLETNIRGTHNVLEACCYNKVRKIIFDSSQAIFGTQKESYPAFEKEDAQPRNYYGLSKYIGERMVENYNNKYNIQSIILRYSRVRTYHSRDVIYKFCKAVNENEPIKITGNPFKEIDFVDLSDVLRANILALEKNICYGIFHISCGHSLGIIDIANNIKQLFNKPLHPVIFEESKSRVEFEPLRNMLDITKAIEILGYYPRVSLFDMIHSTYKYICEEYENE